MFTFVISYILVIPKVTECGRQRSKVITLLLQRCALRKFHVTDGQNTRDQITSDRRSKRAWSKCVLCIPYILSGSPNECWLHTCDACVITSWRLGLRAPLVALNNYWRALGELAFIQTSLPPLSKKSEKGRLWFTVANRRWRPRDFSRNSLHLVTEGFWLALGPIVNT